MSTEADNCRGECVLPLIDFPTLILMFRNFFHPLSYDDALAFPVDPYVHTVSPHSSDQSTLSCQYTKHKASRFEKFVEVPVTPYA